MISFARNLRLIPIVLVAVASLFTLKILGLVLEGGYTLVGWQLTKDEPVETTGSIGKARPPSMPPALNAPAPTAVTAPRPLSWAQKVFNFPDVTGSVDAKKDDAKKDDAKKDEAKKKDAAKKGDAKSKGATPANAMPTKPNSLPAARGILIPLDTGRLASGAERALLERLHERRQELDARARELEIRENLLKVAEKRLQARVSELKLSEEPAPGSPAAKKKKEEAEAAGFKGIVTMYEAMKAKDAAKIFDRLDINILVEVATQINPRRMSDILAQMTPAAAERLTVELANRASGANKKAPDVLPKIGARPNAR